MEDKVSVSQASVKNGLILGLVLIIYGMILQFLNLEIKTMQYFGYLNFGFLIVFVVMAQKAFKEGGDGFMSIGQGLGIGMLVTMIGTILSSIFTYIYLKFIDDSSIQKTLDFMQEEMERQGYDDTTVEQGMAFWGKIYTPELMPILNVVMMAIIGFIIVLLVSLFTKKSNPALEV